MKKLLVTLGSLLAATSALLFLAGREAGRRKNRIAAPEAAALLAEAWSNNRTRV